MRIWALLSLLVIGACVSSEPPLAVVRAPDQLIGYGEVVDGALPSGYSEQRFLFTGQAGDQVEVRLEADQPLQLSLQTAAGEVLGEGAPLNAILAERGVYTLLISQPGSSLTAATFSLGLSRLISTEVPPAPEPSPTLAPTVIPTRPLPTPTRVLDGLGTYLGRIVSGQQVLGVFTTLTERYVYEIEAMPAPLDIELIPEGSFLDPALSLFDEAGRLLATDEGSAGGDRPRIRLTGRTGEVYYIQSRADGLPGGYRLQVISALAQAPLAAETPTEAPRFVWAGPTPAPIENILLRDHTPLSGVIDDAGDVARYTLQARQGEQLTIGVTLTVGSSLRPVLELIDPEGALVYRTGPGVGQTGAGVVGSAVPAPVDGVYSIFVTGESDTTGAFIISAGRDGSHTDVYRGEAAADTPLQGSITWPGLRDVWALNLVAGDVISAAVSQTNSELVPLLELVDLEGRRIAASQNMTTNSNTSIIGSAAVPVSGMYLLRITGLNASSAGAYSLMWRYITAAPTPTPAPDAWPLMTADSTLQAGTVHSYAFQGEAGQSVHVNVIADASSTLDPVAVLFGPDGSVVAAGDDGPADLNPRFSAQLPSTGVYRLEVRSYGDTTGSFVAQVDLLLPRQSP